MPPDMSDELIEESLRELYEHAPCGYVVTNPDGVFARVNQTFVEMTGYPRDELVTGTRLQDLLTAAGKIFYENQYAPLLRMQGFVREVAFDLRRRDRDPLPVLVNSVQRVDADGQPLLVASILLEATDRRTYERELLVARRKAEQLAAIVTAAGDAILTTSPDGIVQTWNPGAERLFGYAAAEIVGGRLDAVLPRLSEKAEGRRVAAELRAGRPVHLETVGRGTGGEPIDVSIGLTPHLGPLGELEAVSAIVRDVSERIRAERKLEAERDAFLATLSHDLKNPLTVIVEYARMLANRASQGHAPPWLARAVPQIEANARRSIGMLDELLDLARLRMGRPLELDRRPTDLVALARDVVAEHQAASERHRIDLRADAPELVGRWDRSRLARVLENVVANAVKYSPGGGPIVVAVERDGEAARLVVRDHGIGIPAADLPRVAERFARASNARHFAGAGIGLTSVHLLVAEHGGSVAIESEEGAGTTVTVRLPFAPKEGPHPYQPTEEGSSVPGSSPTRRGPPPRAQGAR